MFICLHMYSGDVINSLHWCASWCSVQVSFILHCSMLQVAGYHEIKLKKQQVASIECIKGHFWRNEATVNFFRIGHKSDHSMAIILYEKHGCSYIQHLKFFFLFTHIQYDSKEGETQMVWCIVVLTNTLFIVSLVGSEVGKGRLFKFPTLTTTLSLSPATPLPLPELLASYSNFPLSS